MKLTESIKKAFRSLKSAMMWITLRAAGTTLLNVSRGNEKLVSNDYISFIIWNLPAVKTCPFRTPHCEAKCYAIKAEQAYPDCLPSRERNFKESMRDDFVDRAIYTILNAIRFDRKHRKIVVRIHESGDFYNREYAMKWLKVAEALKHENVVFIAYTKSVTYFDGVKLPKNFRLRASVWDDTAADQLEIMNRNAWPIYTAVDKFQKGDKFTRCRCSDCATCGKCWAKYKDIRCEIH